jgi:MinD superfamily P-loop ATPase
VAEPTVSGISDMERIIKTASGFNTRIAVCINKYDINVENSNKIEELCKKQSLDFVGKIPFDSQVAKILNSGRTIIEVDCISRSAVKEVYRKTINILFE